MSLKRIMDTWLPLVFVGAAFGLTIRSFLPSTAGKRTTPEKVTASVASSVTLGQHLPAMAVIAANGRQVELDWKNAGRPTIVYIFSPECTWCLRNGPNAIALAKGVNRAYRIIGVSPDRELTFKYAVDEHIPFEVYVAPEALRRLGLTGTPQTLLLSAEGILLRRWIGVYDGTVRRELESYFKITLPGIER